MIAVLLGHFVGDFMLQPKKMAIRKGESYAWCALHCAIYTATLCAFAVDFTPATIAAVFIPHFVIDRWSLAAVWMYLTGNRDFVKAEANSRQPGLPNFYDPHFTAIVYVVIDQTLHFLCLWVWFALL